MRKELFRYAFPSIVGMLVVGLQTLIDGVFVSRGVGAIGLAAINISMPLINVMLSVAIMVISGGIVLTGIAKGSGDESKVRSYTTLTFVVLVATVLFLSLMLLLNLKRVCYWLGSDDVLYPYVRRYLGIIGGAFIFYCIPNYTEAFTRLSGRPNQVFLSGVICFVVNVVLDYFFVLRMGFGVSGAAVATCIANTTAALVLLHNLSFGRLGGSWREVWLMFYNGSSEMLTSLSAAVTTYVFNVFLMERIGPLGVAALTIVCYLNFIVNMSVFGLSQAMYPLVSTCLGANDVRGIKSLLVNSLVFSGLIDVFVFVVVQVFKHGIVSLFSEGDIELEGLAITAISYVTLHYLVSFVNIVSCSFHTAVARPIESAVIALCRSIVFVLIPLYVLLPLIGDMAIWVSMPLAELLTLAVSVPLMVHSSNRLAKATFKK